MASQKYMYGEALLEHLLEDKKVLSANSHFYLFFASHESEQSHKPLSGINGGNKIEGCTSFNN